jgi:membrane associated rhomboid family serine protease
VAFWPVHDDNPRRWINTPYGTWALILICVIVYVWQSGQSQFEEVSTVFSFGFLPAVIFGHRELDPALIHIPAAWSALIYQFLHGGAWHLIGNMAFMFVFGDNVEDRCGTVRFIIFYLICGAVAALAHGMTNEMSEAPLIGASGGVSGILAAYLILHPTARITAITPIFIPLRLPVWVWIGGWFIFQALASGGMFGSDNVAYWAHIGGFLAGVVLIPLMKRDEARLLEGWR